MTRQVPNLPRRGILAALALAAATAIASPAPVPAAATSSIAAATATPASHGRDTRQETSPEREITTKPIRVDRKGRVCHCARGLCR